MTTPPLVVRILASSTVFVKASSLVNLDLGGMAGDLVRDPGTGNRRRKLEENPVKSKIEQSTE